jgi:hypothetical protein
MRDLYAAEPPTSRVDNAGPARQVAQDADSRLVNALLHRLALAVLIMGLLWTLLIAVVVYSWSAIP